MPEKQTAKKNPRGAGRKYGSKSARKPSQKPLDPSIPIGLETEIFQRVQPVVAMRAAELRARGFVYRELPALLVKEFNIEMPAITTVFGWLNKLDAAVTKDFQALQERMRMDAYWQIEEIKAKWMHRAQGMMHVTTTELTSEGFTEVIDKEAVNEQAKAVKVVLDCISQQAKLLKLNLADEKDTKSGISVLDLQLWITERASQMMPSGPNVVDVQASVQQGPRLEISSGVELLGVGEP